MRIALTHNLRVTESEDEAEFDSPETIATIERALARAGHRVEPIDVTGPASLLVTRLEAFAPDIVFNLAEGHRGKTRRAFYPALFEELGIPSTGQRRVHALRHARQGAHEEAARGLRRAEPARALRHARDAEDAADSTSCPSR